jgi:hypothetical protein
VLGEDLLDFGNRGRRLVARADEEPQAQLIVEGVAVEREAGRVRTTVLTATWPTPRSVSARP